MSEFIKYIKLGMKQSILAEQPNFSINNQYQDSVNIGRDFNYARSIILGANSETKLRKTRRQFKKR